MNDIRRAVSLLDVDNGLPCVCNVGHRFFCHKHGIIGISYDDQKKLKEELK